MTRLYGFIFFLSGATGLIYESVWSHYIKLILGHAAYAQTLVLAIFMGGMAIGAWLVSRSSLRIKNLLMGYAAVEMVIGLFGLIFHAMFGLTSEWLFETLLPMTGGGTAAMLAKWGVATLLILPQSILLGCTFPLMSGGVARLGKIATGSTIALLYFANCIGAVFGVLFAGFFLIAWVGLPGALMTAAIINILIAIVVYRLSKGQVQTLSAEAKGSRDAAGNKAAYGILVASAITAGASFCYEIAWIRMLSMVLGSSTHSFELMLAAFILGLALGGLWIRKRIDHLKNPMLFLGWVQIAMAVFALLTLPLYNLTFDLTSQFMSGLGRTAMGYTFFSWFSHALALLVMLPSTICAGMTLPLLTLILWRKGAGEKAIGQVYAINTLGSIAGVLLAVHVFMPAFGLKGLMLAGAAMDGLLGVVFLGVVSWGGMAWAGGLVLGLFWLAVFLWAQLDPMRMGAGVYRTAKVRLNDGKVLSWEDGKTASIGMFASHDGKYVSITTNGKPDASVNVVDYDQPAEDETTQTMAAFIPMLYKPDARVVANIGFGSGMTTNTLLAFPGIERVDTIEIEAAVIRGAKLGFEKRLPLAFHDSRSRIHIDDARTFFSTQGQKYDLIVSEPSNPWVSGVASLFTEEFYRHTVRYLSPDGVFVQWLQLYETDISVVASVTAALDRVFDDYVIYAADSVNLMIVASPRGKLRLPQPQVLEARAVKEEMKRQLLTGYGNIKLRRLAGKNLWSPLMLERNVAVNSDFFPYVDLNAARFRFMRATATPLTALGGSPVPVLEMMGVREALGQNEPVGKESDYRLPGLVEKARIIRNYVLGSASAKEIQAMNATDLGALAMLKQYQQGCVEIGKAQRDALYHMAVALVPHLPANELRPVWQQIQKTGICLHKEESTRQLFDLIQALSDRDGPAIVKAADTIWQRKTFKPEAELLEYVLLAELLAHVKSGDEAAFLKFGEERLKTSGLKMSKASELLFAMLGANLRAKARERRNIN